MNASCYKLGRRYCIPYIGLEGEDVINRLFCPSIPCNTSVMALGVHQIDSYIEQNNVLMEDFDRKTYLSFFPPLKVRFRILRRAAIYI